MKYIIAILLCFITLTSLSILGSAHPGRTDTNGGHHDGFGYHYHHGYPAHNHTDTDGDGIVDCPYNFLNSTDEDSNSSDFKESPNTTINSTHTVQSTNNTFPWLIFIVSGICGYFVIIHLYRTCKRRIQNAAILRKLNVSGISIPWHIVLLPDGTPTIGNVNPSRPFGDYTVYVPSSGRCFHVRHSCCAKAQPQHLWKISDSFFPCKRCSKKVVKNIPDWYRQLNFMIECRTRPNDSQ